MTLSLHPFIEQVLAAGAGPRGASGYASWQPGDIGGLCAILDEGLAQMRALPAPAPVHMTEYSLDTSDHVAITVRWYEKRDVPDGPAIVFFHGGARIAGSVDLYEPLVRLMVDWAGVPFLSVDYRLAPEFAGSVVEHRVDEDLPRERDVSYDFSASGKPEFLPSFTSTPANLTLSMS